MRPASRPHNMPPARPSPPHRPALRRPAPKQSAVFDAVLQDPRCSCTGAGEAAGAPEAPLIIHSRIYESFWKWCLSNLVLLVSGRAGIHGRRPAPPAAALPCPPPHTASRPTDSPLQLAAPATLSSPKEGRARRRSTFHQQSAKFSAARCTTRQQRYAPRRPVGAGSLLPLHSAPHVVVPPAEQSARAGSQA